LEENLYFTYSFDEEYFVCGGDKSKDLMIYKTPKDLIDPS